MKPLKEYSTTELEAELRRRRNVDRIIDEIGDDDVISVRTMSISYEYGRSVREVQVLLDVAER